MGPVATDTAVHFSGLVFEDKGPALVNMALEAGLLVVVSLVQHFRSLSHSESGGETAVGVVAIAAGHEALVNTMLEWKTKLRAHVRMTPIADFELALGEQVLRRSRIMN